jgi:hypothetical protein
MVRRTLTFVGEVRMGEDENKTLESYMTWYSWIREFIEEKGLQDEYWDWKVEKGYVKE